MTLQITHMAFSAVIVVVVVQMGGYCIFAHAQGVPIVADKKFVRVVLTFNAHPFANNLIHIVKAQVVSFVCTAVSR